VYQVLASNLCDLGQVCLTSLTLFPYLKNSHKMLGVVVYGCNPTVGEVEAGGSQVQDQPGLYSKFEASMGYN
jgi:hypothetical protein